MGTTDPPPSNRARLLARVQPMLSRSLASGMVVIGLVAASNLPAVALAAPGGVSRGVAKQIAVGRNRRSVSRSEPLDADGRLRRRIIGWGLGAGLLALAGPVAGASISTQRSRLEELAPRLREMPHLPPLEGPVLPLTRFAWEANELITRAVAQQVSTRSDVHTLLRKRFGGGARVLASLDKIGTQYNYIPESRPPYADAYRRYAEDVIQFAMDRMGERSPFDAIVVPREAYPNTSADQGIAYIVHQMGGEFDATAAFTKAGAKAMKIRLAGQILRTPLGSVTLNLKGGEHGIVLSRDKHSFWRDSATTLYNLLAVPLEEPLHLLFGEHTDRHIQAELKKLPRVIALEAQRIASHWMSIEEAVVGAVVDQLLLEYTKGSPLALTPQIRAEGLGARKGLPQYAFLDAAMEHVADVGWQHAKRSYADPSAFRAMLLERAYGASQGRNASATPLPPMVPQGPLDFPFGLDLATRPARVLPLPSLDPG